MSQELDLFHEVAQSYNTEQRKDLFSRTAMSFYRIDVDLPH